MAMATTRPGTLLVALALALALILVSPSSLPTDVAEAGVEPASGETAAEGDAAAKSDDAEPDSADANARDADAPKPELELPLTEPLTVETDLTCSACSNTIDAVWYHVKNITRVVRSKDYATRYARASYIIDQVCKFMPNATIHYPPLTKEQRASGKPVMTRVFQLVFPNNQEGWVASEEDSALQKKICRYMIGEHGSKLKQKVAYFSPKETSNTLKTKLCLEWQPRVCDLPPLAPLETNSECLITLFAALEREDYEHAMKQAECAKTPTPKFEKPKSAFSSWPGAEPPTGAKPKAEAAVGGKGEAAVNGQGGGVEAGTKEAPGTDPQGVEEAMAKAKAGADMASYTTAKLEEARRRAQEKASKPEQAPVGL